MTVIDAAAERARRAARRGDVMIGATMKVMHDDRGRSYTVGQVVAIEPMCGSRGIGECLRLMVTRRVVDDVEQPVSGPEVLVVDNDIPTRRVCEVRLRHAIPGRTA